MELKNQIRRFGLLLLELKRVSTSSNILNVYEYSITTRTPDLGVVSSGRKVIVYKTLVRCGKGESIMPAIRIATVVARCQLHKFCELAGVESKQDAACWKSQLLKVKRAKALVTKRSSAETFLVNLAARIENNLKSLEPKSSSKMIGANIDDYDVSDTGIKPIRPVIFKRNGFWTVSPKPRPYHQYTEIWDKAHEHARLLNEKENWEWH